jgi:pyruvate dehydrogenase kinase 2/3/4
MGMGMGMHQDQTSRHNSPIVQFQNRGSRHLSTSTATSTSTRRSASTTEKKISDLSDEQSAMVYKHAGRSQTSASLLTLMKTGRGEFLHKTYKEEEDVQQQQQQQEEETLSAPAPDDKVATDKILMQVAGFLRHELPIRLSHRILDLERVPLMKEMASVKQVRDLYVTSLQELTSVDKQISTLQEEEAFAQILESIYERHASVLVQMARGAFELRAAIRKGTLSQKGKSVVDFDTMDETHAFLDRFYISRIGIRVLIGQYLALRQPPVENYIGLICLKTSPYEIVKRAIDDAAFMCTRKYGDAPEVIITGRLDLTFPYVPTHLHYIMLELLKNSMRATVDWHGIDADYPPIKVVIADGKENEDVIIKVSDEGGGIPRSNMKKIWSYLFTTADPAIQEGMVAFNENVDHGIDSPLAGLGYGLPISRSYARYFGGDVSLMSMEGHGTDAFVYLTRLGKTREPLPI